MTNLETIEAKPREIVLKQYVDKYARDIQQNPFWHQPDQWYRWLVKLECECISEVLTRGDETPPTEWDYRGNALLSEEPIYKQTWVGHPHGQHICILGDKYDYREARRQNPFPSGCCEPSGYIWCAAHNNKSPWQEITEWINRQKLLHLESGVTRQLWSVKLSCGHCDTASCEVEWSPGIPSHLNQESLEKMTAWLESPDAAEAKSTEFIRGQIEHRGFMFHSPPIDTECYKCANLRRIVEYRQIGKLASHPLPLEPKVKPEPKPTAEEIKAQKLDELRKVEGSLKRMEAKAERLRREIQ